MKERYASAAEMQADLVLLQSGRSVRGLHAFESRLRAAKRAGFVAAAVAVAALAALALTSWKARVEGESRARTEAALVRAALFESMHEPIHPCLPLCHSAAGAAGGLSGRRHAPSGARRMTDRSRAACS